MRVSTRYFGEIEIGEEKIIHFENGIPGFEEYKDYTIVYDIDSEEEPLFSWLQCVTEQGLAFPIVNPFRVDEKYDPIVEDELLIQLGEFQVEDLAVFLIATVPADPKKTSVNKKAPLLINTVNRRGMQVIVENEDYEIKHMLVKED